MLNTPPKVQSQLSESLSIICGFDFPTRWPTLLPELVAQLTTATAARDLATVGGVLATANSIFKRYRNQYRSELGYQGPKRLKLPFGALTWAGPRS